MTRVPGIDYDVFRTISRNAPPSADRRSFHKIEDEETRRKEEEEFQQSRKDDPVPGMDYSTLTGAEASVAEAEYKGSEEYRQSELKANEEMLLARSHQVLADSNFSAGKSLMVGLGSSTMSKIHRVLGNEQKANQYSRFGGAIETAQQEREKGGPVSDFLQRNVRGIARSLATAVPAAAVGGVPLVLAMFTGDQANESYTEATDAGLTGKERVQHVATMALIEGGVAGAFSLAGAGGFEGAVGTLVKPAAKAAFKGLSKDAAKIAAKKLVKGAGYETIEELMTAGGQMAEGVRSGVSPDPNVGQALGDAAFQAVAGTAAAGAPGLARARQEGRYAKIRSEILEAAKSDRAPSVRQYKKWGLPGGTNRATRKEGVDHAAAQIMEVEQAEADAESLPGIQEAIDKSEVPGEILAAEQAETAPTSPQEAAEARPVEPPAAKATTQPGATAALKEASGQPGGPPEQTSIANAPVADLRAARGEETALPAADRKTFQDLLDGATQRATETPNASGRLVEELNEAPRSISDEEVADLQLQYRKLTDEYNAAAEHLFKAQKSGNKAAIKIAKKGANTILGEIRNAERAYKKAGTEQGRSLAARAMAIKPDMTLGSIVRELRVAKNGKDLDAAEMAKAKKISEKALANEAKQATLRESKEAQDAEDGVERAIKRSKKKTFKKRSAAKTAEAKERVKAALADFKGKVAAGGPGSKPKGPGEFLKEESGALDVELVESGIKLVAAYVDLGVSTFVEFYANVQSQLGIPKAAGRAKESLRAAWTFAQTEGMIPQLEVDPSDAGSMRKFANGIVKTLVETGTTELNEVVDAVHEELQAISPDITRRQTMDTISGYGAASGRTRSDISKTISDLKRQLRKIAEGEDVEATTKKRVAEKIKTLDRAIAKIESELKSSDTGPKKKPTEVTSPEIKAKQGKLDGLRAERKAQRELANPKPDPEVAKTATYKRTLTKRIADLERRIKEGDYSKRAVKRTKLDEDALALQFEAKELKSQLDAMEEGFRRSQLKGFKKLGRYVGEAADIARATKTSMDLSALLRQAKFGVLASYRNPKLVKDSVVNMVKAFWSAELAFNISEELKNDPVVMVGDKAGLSTTEIGGKRTDNEEAFRSVLSERIPLVAGSERAYVIGLNTMRRGYFKALYESMEAGNVWREGGKVTDEEARGIANVVNVFTGRGQLSGALLSATEFLSTVMFAPRFVVSRFQIALGQPLYGGNARTKKLVAEQYAKSIGGMAAIYSLAAVGGMFALKDEEKPLFEWDPRSTEFGKIRWGDVILDPLAGVSQVFTVLSRLVPGFWGEAKYKTSTGEIVRLQGDDRPFGGPSVSSVGGKFLQSKLSPLFGAIWSAAAQENIIGDETNAYKEMIDLPKPLAFGDVYDALQVEGYTTKAILAGLALFGDGVNRYQSADEAKFANKLTAHPKLEFVSEATGKEVSFTEATKQIEAHARKRGLTQDGLIQALKKDMREAGKGGSAIRKKKRLLKKRFPE